MPTHSPTFLQRKLCVRRTEWLGWWQLSNIGQPTEAQGCREPTKHGVLPCLAEGGGWGVMICILMDVPYPHCRRTGAAQLRASGNSSCCCCSWYITKCTQTPTSPKSRKEGRGRLSMYSMAAPWGNWSRKSFTSSSSAALQPVKFYPRRLSRLSPFPPLSAAAPFYTCTE